MANELTVSAGVRFAKTGNSVSKTEAFATDVTGDEYKSGVYPLTVSEISLTGTLPTVSTDAGYVLFKATNFATAAQVEIGVLSAQTQFIILENETFGPVRLNAAQNLFFRTDGGTANLEYTIIEA